MPKTGTVASPKDGWLRRFVTESNRIEGIAREPLKPELDAHVEILDLPVVTVGDFENLVRRIAGAPIRTKAGMDVRVGDHLPPRGGPEIRERLQVLLDKANRTDLEPAERLTYNIHHSYETLHPFMDGNGRSGRALWLWMMERHVASRHAPWRELGFLHWWYYQSLQYGRP